LPRSGREGKADGGKKLPVSGHWKSFWVCASLGFNSWEKRIGKRRGREMRDLGKEENGGTGKKGT